MKKFINKLTIILLIITILGPNFISAQMECNTPQSQEPPELPPMGQGCSRFLDPDRAGSYPVFTINVAIHFIGVGHGNFYDGPIDDWDHLNGTTEAIAFLNKANSILANIEDNPAQTEDFLGDSKIRLRIVPNYEDGVHFWNSPSDYIPVPGVLNIKCIDEACPPTGCLKGWTCHYCNVINLVGWYWDEWNNKWHSWDFAHLLLHELGHVLGLDHSWYSTAECSDVDIDYVQELNSNWGGPSTNMMHYNNSQRALSPCQWSHMYSNVYDGVFDLAEIDCNIQYDDIIVSSDETWDERTIVMGNVIITNNATLTITCDVDFNQNSIISVESGSKLIVDGAKLSTIAQCTDTWKGIRVAGGNSDFDVSLQNDAVIENTSGPAVSMFPNLPWPQMQQFGNGILHATNTTFNNCNRMVEFIAFTPSINLSYVSQCTQNGGTWGITNWNCQGISVSNNVFNNIQKYCMVTEAGSITITNNEFHSLEGDVLFNNVSAGIPSAINNNQFYGANTGYKALGTTFGQYTISNNTFQNGLYGMYLDGSNRFIANNNDFVTSPVGALCMSSGAQFDDNLFDFNTFSGNTIGITPLYDNPSLNFTQNCFTTTNTDVYIIGDVKGVISNNGESADNCFTHQGDPNSPVVDLGGVPNPFIYVEPFEHPGFDCYNAIKAHPNVIRDQTGSTGYPCGGMEPNGLVSGGNTLAHDSKSPLQNSISPIFSVEELRAKAEKEGSISSLKPVLNAIAPQWRESKGTTSSIGAPSDDEIVLAFSTYLLDGDIDGAKEYLDNIVPNSEALSDFVTVQNINIWRLQNGPFAEVSPSDVSTLYQIGVKTHPYATYARALYFVLTGEELNVELPEFLQQIQVRQEKKNDLSSKLDCIVSPNPFSDMLLIKNESSTQVLVSINDLQGRSIFEKHLSGKQSKTILTSDWAEGVYIVSFANSDNKILYKSKLIHLP